MDFVGEADWTRTVALEETEVRTVDEGDNERVKSDSECPLLLSVDAMMSCN